MSNYLKGKKVCIISKFIFANDTRSQQQAKTLSASGARVDVLCLAQNEIEKRIENRVTIYTVAKPRSKETIIKYIWSTFKFALPSFMKLQKLALRRKYDLIVIHTLPEFLIFIASFQKIRGTKILLDVRDTSVELFNSKWGKNCGKILKKIVRTASNLSCSFADRIITASPGFKKKLIERKVPGEKITVIYNSADTSIFKFDRGREFKRITSGVKLIYHGTVAERIGIDIAIRALSLLQEKIPSSELNIYGFYDADYKVKLNKLITELNLEKSVFLSERKSLENIYELIKNSDIGIDPCINDEFMQLALSTKMFEYVASGIPVISSRLRTAGFALNDECVLYSTPNDPKKFADNIERLCLNPDLRKSLVDNAYAAHNTISGEVMAKLYLEIVNDLTK